MRVAHIALAGVATALSLLHNTRASEACLRTLTAACDDGKTACIEDCYGRVLDDLEYVEAQDASDEDIEPPMALSDTDAEDALGISVAYAGAERLVIDSLPRFTRWLYISDVPLSSEKPLTIPSSKAKLRSVYLSGHAISSLARLALPDSVTTLSVFESSLTSLSDARLPPKLQTLYAAKSKIAAIGSLPSTVKHLDLHANALSSLDGAQLPAKLETLDVSSNRLERLADVVFPDTLHSLRLDSNALREIANVTFPSTRAASVSIRKTTIQSIRLTAAQWKAFATAMDASVVVAMPTNASACTSGHFVEDSEKASETFTACLLID